MSNKKKIMFTNFKRSRCDLPNYEVSKKCQMKTQVMSKCFLMIQRFAQKGE